MNSYDDMDEDADARGCLWPVALLVLLLTLALVSCETVAPDAFDQAEASIFNEAFHTNVIAQPKRKLMFVP